MTAFITTAPKLFLVRLKLNWSIFFLLRDFFGRGKTGDINPWP